MIPTKEDFVKDVGKGPKLSKVTSVLGDYWKYKPGRTLAAEVDALRLLIDACKAWIKVKDSKSNMKTTWTGKETNNFNTKLLDRRLHVAKLGEEATKELITLLKSNDLLKSDLRGQLSFDIRKFRTKGTHPISRHTTKMLSQGYEQERQTWLSSGKTSSISGSKIHDLSKKENVEFTENKINRLRGKGFVSDRQEIAYAKIMQGTGGAEEWKLLSEIEKIGDLRVAFFRKSERYEFMAYIEQGLFVDGEGKRLNKDQVLWTMDSYGNMFIYDTDIGKKLGIKQVNHSSMNSGREVICAGMISVDDGLVTYVTNTSGHYKPTKPHLAEALNILNDDGLNLSKARVMAVRFPGPSHGTVWWQTFDLRQFLNSGGNCQPLKEEEGPEP